MHLWEVAKIHVEEGITRTPAVDDLGDLLGVMSPSDLVEYDLSVERDLTVVTQP